MNEQDWQMRVRKVKLEISSLKKIRYLEMTPKLKIYNILSFYFFTNLIIVLFELFQVFRYIDVSYNII